ncbi:MAG: response regulator [Melioribacteraceae bacterium]|nr:response regulator [Melioribacteraceae bacterium]
MERLKILLIEDEVYLANDIKRNLEEAGHTVISVNSEELSEVDSEYLLQAEIGLIDVVLKGKMDGVQVAEKILAKNKIPIILIGNYCDDDILKKAKKVHPFAFLIKPFGGEELITTIHLAKKRFTDSNELSNRISNESYQPLINQKKIIENINKKIENITKEELAKSVNNSIPDLKYIKINFNELFNENQVLLLIIDKEGVIKFSNEAFSNLTGIENNHLVNTNIYDLIHNDDKTKFNDIISQEHSRGITKKLNIRILSIDGHSIRLETSVEYLVNGENQNYFSITALNTDELKHLRSIFHNISNHFGRNNRYSIDEIKRINLILKLLNSIFKDMSAKNKQSARVQRNMYSLVEFSELLLSEIDDMSEEEILNMTHKI